MMVCQLCELGVERMTVKYQHVFVVKFHTRQNVEGLLFVKGLTTRLDLTWEYTGGRTANVRNLLPCELAGFFTHWPASPVKSTKNVIHVLNWVAKADLLMNDYNYISYFVRLFGEVATSRVFAVTLSRESI
uniref:Uncharacterized protein n=1 Tax=Timema cristinae TaxID=61476 RepID=A0A7R9D0I4_TIMCR|nr:unnamed protein product [Timema cristinae]